MKKIKTTIFLLMIITITFGQKLIQGKEFESENKNAGYYYLWKTGDEIFYLYSPINIFGKNINTKIIQFKINGNTINKGNETLFNIESKKLTYMSGNYSGEGIFFVNDEVKCFYVGYSQEFVDNSFTLKKGLKGRFVIEKYDINGNLVNSFGVDKKVSANKDYYFNVAVSENGKHIGFINNTDYSVYNTNNFQLEKSFELKSLPEKGKAKFSVLSDGSLLFITLTNPIVITKCDVKTGEVNTFDAVFENENNFNATFKISDDEMFLTICCNFNDQKNKEVNTTSTKGIQLLGIELTSLELIDNINFIFGPDLLEKMDETNSISYLNIENIFKIADDYYLISDISYSVTSKNVPKKYNENILLMKLNKDNKNYEVIKRYDINADLYTFMVNEKPCIIYSTDMDIKMLSGYKYTLLCLEIDENLKNRTLLKEDFKTKPVKISDFSFQKIDENKYFILINDFNKYMPLLLTF